MTSTSTPENRYADPPASVAGRDVDAVNLCVSPRVGAREVGVTAARYVFLQPGADAPSVVRECRRLGKVAQRGCVLVDAFPPRP